MDVGLGFHAQMTLEEAVTFGEAREAKLMTQVEALTGQAAGLKAKIKIAVGAIDEVGSLPVGGVAGYHMILTYHTS